MMVIMSKHFRPYNLDQPLLFAPSLQDWLAEDHLAHFVSDVVDSVDLSAIFMPYELGDQRGAPPYHPAMMVKLLIYGYCTGVRSSRQIERATSDNVPFRFLSANQHPDHNSISEFRRRHLKALGALFVQVLLLCQKAGLVKLGHVALDGTKMKANASKHKAMSYGRMDETEKRLTEEVERLLKEAEQVDTEEDAKYGKGKRADEIPGDLKRREDRLKKIREAKAALEQEAQEKANLAAEEARQKVAQREQVERDTGKKPGGKPPQVLDPAQAKPDPKAQRNFTDPESRIMVDGATKGFIQGYNAQAAVDSENQIVVATIVSQCAADANLLVPMVLQVEANLGVLPEKTTADTGYFSAANVTDSRLAGTDLFIPPKKARDADSDKPKCSKSASDPVAAEMRDKLKTPKGHAVYKDRKATVEPVFGQTKAVRGFRHFLFRGLAKVAAEWQLICLTHNLLKLFRAGQRPKFA